MELTQQQIESIFELLELATEKQRNDLLGRLTRFAPRDEKPLYEEWTDGVTQPYGDSLAAFIRWNNTKWGYPCAPYGGCEECSQCGLCPYTGNLAQFQQLA